jgi:hypothetical protein
MDGEGAWRNNVFVERFYLSAYDSGAEPPHIDWPLSRMGADLTRALTGARPIKLTSPRCPSAWQPNHARRSTYPRGKTVQTTETNPIHLARNLSNTKSI